MIRKRGILSLVLIVCMTLPMTVFAGSAGDTKDTESEKAGGEVTREAFTEMLAQASGEDLQQYAAERNPFTDVDNENTFVKWAYAKWLINGNGGGKFRPETILTRQEAAAILGRYLEYKYTQLPAGCGTGMPDMTNIARWAQPGVSKCWMYGVIPEENDSDFRPLDKVSAADAALWIKNAQSLDASVISQPQKKTFADGLIAGLDGKTKADNWSVSPYSAQIALAMLANGAKGETQKELLRALQIENIDQYNETAKKLMERYESYDGVMSLETANSLWMNQSWFGGKGVFLPDYKQKMQQYYAAEARDVTGENSVEEVNRWVKEKTKEKIPSILTDDNRDFVTALVNAVYFKAAWDEEFSKSATKPGDFTNADGTTSKTDFMHQRDYFGYFSTPGIEAVKLNYRKYTAKDEFGTDMRYFKDADFSMYLIKAEDEYADLQNILDHAKFENTDVIVSMPKFKVECGVTLDDSLKALGVKTAYSKKADLSGILNPKALPSGEFFIDTVLQKSYVSVDEEGTEAAAVTAVVAAGSAAPPEREPLVREFKADQPFYFVIRDNTGGEILFAGAYRYAK